MSDTPSWLCAQCLADDPTSTNPANVLVEGTAVCADHWTTAVAAARAEHAETGTPRAQDDADAPPLIPEPPRVMMHIR